MKQKDLIKKFDEFIESRIIDDNEFQEYEICIIEFDSKIIQEGEGFCIR